MPDEETKSLSLVAAYPFATQHNLGEQAAVIRSMAIDGFKNQHSSVRRGYMLKLLEEHGLLAEFIAQHWSYGKTPGGEAKRRRYLQLWARHEAVLSGRDLREEADDDEESSTDQSFAVESDLRDYLAHNLSVIEPGLRVFEQGERKGVEFPVAGGFIDILAKDRDGRFAVIELKLSRGRNKTIGQLLYYMGWVDKNLGGREPCRGLIVAREITDDLLVATTRAPGVSLHRYRIAMVVEAVPDRRPA